jgi:hypothetical protein
MSSNRKIESNRANAQRSTGPKTEQGKAVSSRNATRHGLAGNQVVIKDEDPAAYEALRQELIDSYKPANAAELALVEEITQCFWRLQRARALEAETFNMASVYNDPIIGFRCEDAAFTRIRRYMTTIERAWHRAMEQLERAQSLRRKEEKAEKADKTSRPVKEPVQPKPLPRADIPQPFVIPVAHPASAPVDSSPQSAH